MIINMHYLYAVKVRSLRARPEDEVKRHEQCRLNGRTEKF